MSKVCKRWKCRGLLLGLMLFAAGFAMHSSTLEAEAAVKNGLVVQGGKTYYYKNGKKMTGIQKVNGKYYYFASKTGERLTGWCKSSSGARRFFDRTTAQMRTGLVRVDKDFYYFHPKTGWAQKGFQQINGFTRYFDAKDYSMATGWMRNSKDQRWYFEPRTGKMYKGLKKVGSDFYYFYSKTGEAKSGFINFGSNRRYFYESGSKVYKMAKGWVTSSKGEKRYFDTGNGFMKYGKTKVGSKWYNFDKSTGIAKGGWLVEGKSKRYFDPSTLVMVTGKRTIDGVEYEFSSTGLLIGTVGIVDNNPVTPTTPTAVRTIKNYLLNAIQPVGRTLYIWGGGHNSTDATRKGISTKWTQFYNSQSSSYDYNNYRYQTEKGLDCSGYIGWATYQVTGQYSTYVSGDIGAEYTDKGWGSILTQSNLSSSGYKLYPGDIGYDYEHTWMILGQCKDLSAVILHSTPNAGVQIAGTPTPSGNYSSQAIALAEKYMEKFPGYQKMQKTNPKFYRPSTGAYVRRGNYFRWNTKTISDPNGYKYKTADQILADLFS